MYSREASDTLTLRRLCGERIYMNSVEFKLTILLPCLNEAETLEVCIEKSQASIQKAGWSGEVLIADNGSTDGSKEIAVKLGARVVEISKNGYGAALIGGIREAKSEYIIMGDADDSYALDDLQLFISKLDEGFDLVMGNRFQGGIEPGAMPWLHKYLGNPVLSWLGRLFFKVPVRDFHCGLRAFRSDAIRELNLKSTGMEFASEMVVKASLSGLKITEVPTTLKPDGRSRAPHLKTWRDGWRHLVFLLAASPRWSFIYPGMLSSLIGILLIIAPLRNQTEYLFFTLFPLLGMTLVNIGFLAIFLGIMARVFSTNLGTIPANKNSKFISEFFTFQNGILIGSTSAILGLISLAINFINAKSFVVSVIDPHKSVTNILSLCAISVGFQLIFTSFLASLMQTLNPNTSD